MYGAESVGTCPRKALDKIAANEIESALQK